MDDTDAGHYPLDYDGMDMDVDMDMDAEDGGWTLLGDPPIKYDETSWRAIVVPETAESASSSSSDMFSSSDAAGAECTEPGRDLECAREREPRVSEWCRDLRKDEWRADLRRE